MAKIANTATNTVSAASETVATNEAASAVNALTTVVDDMFVTRQTVDGVDMVAVTLPKGMGRITAENVITKQASADQCALWATNSPAFAAMASKERWFPRKTLAAFGTNKDGCIVIVCTAAQLAYRGAKNDNAVSVPPVPPAFAGFFK